MELTEGIRNALKNAAAALKGHARRVFMAQVVRDLGRGGQRQAQAQLGWSRDTIRKGEHELSTGIQCVDARSATGAKPIDVRLPNLRQDIRDLVDGQSQADPRFESERVYCKLSAANVGCVRSRSDCSARQASKSGSSMSCPDRSPDSVRHR